MPKRKPKFEMQKSVILKCRKCGALTYYPQPHFEKVHRADMEKDGYITQACGCVAHRGCDLNTPHRELGLLTTITIEEMK